MTYGEEGLTPGDVLREAHRRISARELVVAPPHRLGLLVARDIVDEVLAEVMEAPPPGPIATLPFLDNLCHMCGLPYRPDEYLDGHPECREQE